jgi:putative transposase
LRRREPDILWPARSTVCGLLKARGLVRARRRRAPSPFTMPSILTPMTRPNQVWTTDFKGKFRTGDRAYCYPLTLRDGFSRFVLRCGCPARAHDRRDAPTVRARICRLRVA